MLKLGCHRDGGVTTAVLPINHRSNLINSNQENVWTRLETGVLYLIALAMPVSIAAANIAFGLGLLLLIRRAFTGGMKDRGVWNSVTLLIVAMGLWDLVAVLVSDYPIAIKHWGEDKWVFVAAFLPFALVRDVRRGTYALYLMMLSGLVTASVALFQNISGYDPLRDKLLEDHGGSYMAVGFFTHHLTYGGIALLILFTTVAWGVFGPGRSSPIRAAFVNLLAAVGLFATFARSALVGIGGGGLALLMLAPKKLRLWIIGVGIAGVVGLLVLSPGMMTRFQYFSAGSPDSANESARWRLWGTAINIIEAHPVFGVGEPNWRYAFKEYKIPGHYVSVAHPHCDFLSAGVDGGIVAMVIFVALFAAYFRQGAVDLRDIASDHPARWGIVAGLTGVAGILIAGLFQNYLTDAEVGNIVWFMVGMSLVLGNLARKEQHG